MMPTKLIRPACLGAVLALTLAPGRAAAVGFEASEGYPTARDISASANWAISPAGSGRITDAQSHDGEQSLRIPASPAAERAATTSFTVPKEGVVFLDFYLRPVADASESPLGTVDANGAILGFLKDGEEGSLVAVVNPTPAKKSAAPPSNAKDTAFRFPVDEQNAATDWIRLTIRQDAKAKTWDLFVNGELTLIDQPLGVTSKKAAVIHFYASAQADTFLDDLVIAAANPLFPDADRDAIPDAVEKASGTDPLVSDRAAKAIGSRLSNLERFLLGSANGAGTLAGSRIIYVDNAAGDDANAGGLSYRTTGNGPKATLSAAIQSAFGDTTIAILPTSLPYKWPNEVANRKSTAINLLPLGEISTY